MITIHVPQSRELAALLRGTGLRCGRQLDTLANAAEPDNGMAGHAVLDGGNPGPGSRHAGGAPSAADLAPDVAEVLRRARAAGSPAARHLESILRQIGAPVPAREPEPAAPELPPAPVPPPPPAA